MTGNFLDDLRAAVRDAGVPLTAQATHLAESTVRRFLKDPTGIRVSTLANLAVGLNRPIGELHLIIAATGQCQTCDQPRDAHYPLFPEAS